MSGKEKKDAAASHQRVDSGSSSGASAALPGTVSVSSVDLGDKSSRRGFRINVSMERSRPEMLMSVLEAFEALGLDADVSCADDTPFLLQAIGGKQQQGTTTVDEEMVEQAVLQAITKCMEDQNNDGDE